MFVPYFDSLKKGLAVRNEEMWEKEVTEKKKKSEGIQEYLMKYDSKIKLKEVIHWHEERYRLIPFRQISEEELESRNLLREKEKEEKKLKK